MDASLFALSFWVAYQLRSNQWIIDQFQLDPIAPFESFLWFYLVLIPISPLVLEAQGFYNRSLAGSRLVTAWQLIKGCTIITVGLIIVLFFFRLIPARWVVVWFGAISFALVYSKEEILRVIYQSKIAQAQQRRRFIIAGAKTEIETVEQELKRHKATGIEIVARLDLGESSADDLVKLLHDHSVNGVILSAKHTYFEQVEAVIKACELEGVEAWVVADFFGTQISRTTFDDFYGRPVMVFSSAPEMSWQGMAKQLMDFLGALALLLVTGPFIMLPAAILIKLTSKGPVLFKQKRSGLNGAPFTIYKFRTMITNAEQKKHEIEIMNEMKGPVFKVTNDPRITPIGKWLRRYSIDEFPQLFNVLRGEMSLVGPRPLPVDEVRRFDDLAHRRRLSVKPGLTCLWQISGRNRIVEFQDWVRLDLEYIDNWSLWLDLKILIRTIPVVLMGTGAK